MNCFASQITVTLFSCRVGGGVGGGRGGGEGNGFNFESANRCFFYCFLSQNKSFLSFSFLLSVTLLSLTYNVTDLQQHFFLFFFSVCLFTTPDMPHVSKTKSLNQLATWHWRQKEGRPVLPSTNTDSSPSQKAVGPVSPTPPCTYWPDWTWRHWKMWCHTLWPLPWPTWSCRCLVGPPLTLPAWHCGVSQKAKCFLNGKVSLAKAKLAIFFSLTFFHNKWNSREQKIRAIDTKYYNINLHIFILI